jgi:hypothetical protein
VCRSCVRYDTWLEAAVERNETVHSATLRTADCDPRLFDEVPMYYTNFEVRACTVRWPEPS